jgi:hypothetical protein
MKIKMKTLLFFTTLLAMSQAIAVERYVRSDGGTWEQCDGTANVAYSDSITNKACAVKHLFELLTPEIEGNEAIRMNGGDIVNIMNNDDGSPGEYIMGRHGDYVSGGCNINWNYACVAAPIPSGTESEPTIIRGGDSNICLTKPTLYGVGRAQQILNINEAEHIQISCLTITDKSSCIGPAYFPDKSVICDRSAPYDKLFADRGLLIRDSSHITLKDLDIKGLIKGIHAGRLGDVTLERVNIFANSSVGWDGDIAYTGGDGNSNTGTILFKDSSINFNGCGLIYNPGQPNHETPHSCAHQDYGGYGDGVGTGATGGDWIFDNVKVMHNNSDGIDLLYHSLGGKVTVKNSHIEGNAGNQLKISGNSDIINNIIIANCGWSSRQEDGLGKYATNCRAQGNPLALPYTHTDSKVRVINNTVISEGDCMMGAGGSRTGVESAEQSIYVVNNVFYARQDYHQDWQNSCMNYTTAPYPITQIHNNIIHKVKAFKETCADFQSNIPEGANAGICTTINGSSYYDNDDYSVASNPHYPEIKMGIRYSAYDVETLELESNRPYALDSQSPIVKAGYSGNVGGMMTPTTDYYGNLRGEKISIGAIEYRAKTKPPFIEKIITAEQ